MYPVGSGIFSGKRSQYGSYLNPVGCELPNRPSHVSRSKPSRVLSEQGCLCPWELLLVREGVSLSAPVMYTLLGESLEITPLFSSLSVAEIGLLFPRASTPHSAHRKTVLQPPFQAN